MIYSSVMVLNVGNYSCQAKSVSTSCQANIVFLYTTNICLLGVHCFLKVEMKYLQTRLFKTREELRGSCLWILVDINIHIRKSFYTIYSQPNISDVSMSCKSLRLQETAEIQANLQSPVGCLVEDGDRHCHCDLGIPRCDGSIFFLHSCVLKRCSLPIFQAMPNFSKTLQSLLMRLVLICKHCFAAKFTCPGQS